MKKSNIYFDLSNYRVTTTMEEPKGNTSKDSMSKLISMQKVMKKKFEKAYANRLNHETNVNKAIEPLVALSSSTPIKNEHDSLKETVSHRNLSEDNTQQSHLAAKSYSNATVNAQRMSTKNVTTKITDCENECKKVKNINIIHNDFDNANELCDKLRLLLTQPITDKVNQTVEVNKIIRKLRDLNVIH